ncbi:hypothetical protein LOC67_07510 [Stieleria sp. JC731]|uniref:hypothetical protein n=1 Tax=Pirellulaceae TaxID=2691357 RepID=UPI001E4B9F6C|nr:hypothetical protein [Stieleria sp. JC731]MCC9600403.1 hypothetical protein [Stieleria sp. JC731]
MNQSRFTVASTKLVCGMALVCMLAVSPIASADPPTGKAASAEFGGANTGGGLGNEITKFSGTLKGAQRGVLVVTKEDGSEATVAPPDNLASFQFIAKAKPAYLQRGMLVRFYGTFGPGGVPVAPINKVTLFQPVDQRAIVGHAKDQFKPGVYSEGKDKGRNGNAMMGKFMIVGQLANLTPNGIMAVHTGKVPVQVQVNTETEFEIRYNNLNLAKEGDKVNVSGFYNPPNENQVKADKVTITTDRIFGEPQPDDQSTRRKRGKRETSKDSDSPEEKKGDKADDQEDNKEAKDGDEAE